VSLCTLPVVLVNALPRAAFVPSPASAAAAAATTALAAAPYAVELLGLALFVAGLGLEVAADRQKSRWVADKKAKRHSEEFLTTGLWSRSRHPNYFGEITLWTGIAVAAAGVLNRAPAQAALGLGGGVAGRALVTTLCAASPAFVAFLLLKVSGVPLSEKKYDRKYGDREEYKRWKRETPVLVPKFF